MISPIRLKTVVSAVMGAAFAAGVAFAQSTSQPSPSAPPPAPPMAQPATPSVPPATRPAPAPRMDRQAAPRSPVNGDRGMNRAPRAERPDRMDRPRMDRPRYEGRRYDNRRYDRRRWDRRHHRGWRGAPYYRGVYVPRTRWCVGPHRMRHWAPGIGWHRGAHIGRYRCRVY